MTDLLSLILIITGAVITFSSKYLVRLLKFEETDIKIIIMKTIGFLIVIVGCLRVFEII